MDKKPVHRIRLKIRWGDMDMMGHVNNAVYFRYLEQARVEWLEEVGGPPDPKGQGPVVVNARCTFLRQLKYPGEIELTTYIGSPGRSSFETYQEIRRVDEPDVLYAEGGAKVVWVDLPEGKSTPMPDWLRELME